MINYAILTFHADLERVISECYTPQPHVVLIESLFDLKEWLSPCIEDLHGHSRPLCFRFTTNATGSVLMYYRQWSGVAWEPENGLCLLKVRMLVCVHVCKT